MLFFTLILQYYWLHSFPVLLQDCTICMEALAGPSGYKGPGVGGISRAESVGRLSQCGHQYHLQCLVAMYNNGNKDGSLQCPTCKTIYGVKTGNQPPGKMEYHVIPHSLPGHPDCKTIRIIYNIPPGIQVLIWSQTSSKALKKVQMSHKGEKIVAWLCCVSIFTGIIWVHLEWSHCKSLQIFWLITFIL